MYRISYLGNQYYPSWDIELCYEEMVEIFFGFTRECKNGNELFESAMEKATIIRDRLPATNY